MILNPVQNSAVFETQWLQKRPRVTQHFGLNPHIYAQFGMKGHNGTDFGLPIGTPIFAAEDGIVKVKDSGSAGYGLHVRIRNQYKDSECVYAHLTRVNVVNGLQVSMGDVIGYSGNTGFSTGPHLHFGRRLLKRGDEKKLWEWQVFDYNNGYFGYYDVVDFLVCWRGGLLRNNF